MNWRKISIFYLLLLLAVCLIPLTFKTRASVSDYVLREASKIIKQFPVVSISKGQVSADVLMPYTIKDPENNASLIIIDTTGQVTSLAGSDALVLLTKTQLIFRKDQKETRTLDLSDIDSLVIDQPRLYDWMDTFLEYFPYILYPVALLFTFLVRISQAILFALVAIGFSNYLKLYFRYRTLLSLSIVSMTPAILLDTLYNYSGMTIPFWWLIDFALALGYLFFSLKSNVDK